MSCCLPALHSAIEHGIDRIWHTDTFRILWYDDLTNDDLERVWKEVVITLHWPSWTENTFGNTPRMGSVLRSELVAS
jgi:hypothetical protein